MKSQKRSAIGLEKIYIEMLNYIAKYDLYRTNVNAIRELIKKRYNEIREKTNSNHVNNNISDINDMHK